VIEPAVAATMEDQANRLNILFMAAVHLITLAVLGWSCVHQPAWPNVVLALVWYWGSGLSITGGYHRLFAHGSYRCSRAVAIFYLLFGAAAVQNSALTWVADHRRHHAHTDSDDDPSDARRGFWWAHMGWVLHGDAAAANFTNVRDLLGNRLVALQHRFYLPIAVAMAGVVPALIGMTWGDPFGAFLWAGCVRLVAQYHATFAINSIAHRFGRRPYSTTTSARDNPLVALLALGEGYHNFHHRFPSDYRNGVRWVDYDPTKWMVRLLAAVGLASHLKRTSRQVIARARRQQIHSS
jgi:stearoyl-CoA desaturase (delta-9 desaturase)